MKADLILKNYEIAKERYAALGVDTDKAIETLEKTPISLHCWQADDVVGFERGEAASGGIQSTGNYPGKARNIDELRQDIEKVNSLLAGTFRLNLHEIYGEFGGKQIDRNEVTVDQFTGWMQWAKDQNMKLDFNSTSFSHPKSGSLSLSNPDPAIREFWIERPKPTDKRLTIYALLDSPRATGAYRFVIMPGRDTVVDVQSKVYLRDKVGKLGVAPLTSMFLFGSNQPSPALNYRPALHDSNGLSILAGNGEWIWRPLNNPKHLAVSSYAMENPQGFGLLQRGRQFSRFEDLDDRYDLRPSAWITPKGEWGKGKIELVEIPTNDETNDNIVTYWTPDQLPEPGKEMNFKYTITFSRDEDKLHAPDNAWVQQTRRSTGDVKQSNLIRQPDGTIAFVVDFTGAEMKKLPEDTPVTAQTSIGDNGEIVESTVRYNPVTKGWRLVMRVKVKDAKKTTEMRAALVNADQTLSETWSYQLPANE